MDKPIVFLHGKPSTQESTDKDLAAGLEKRIANQFFGTRNIEVEEYLLIQVVRFHDKTYSVNTYFHNGSDVNCRGNGYFAISCILEGCVCAQPSRMYEVLNDRIYDKMVLGQFGLINRSGRYLIASFSQEKSKIIRIEDSVVAELQKLEYMPIDDSFKTCGTSLDADIANPKDVSEKRFFEGLKSTGCYYISSSVPDKNEAKIKELNRIIEDQRSKIRDLTSEVENKNAYINELCNARDDFAPVNPDPIETNVGPNWGYDNGAGDFKRFRLADIVIVVLIVVSILLSVVKCSGESSVRVEETLQQAADTTTVKNQSVTQQVLDETVKSSEDSGSDKTESDSDKQKAAASADEPVSGTKPETGTEAENESTSMANGLPQP